MSEQITELGHSIKTLIANLIPYILAVVAAFVAVGIFIAAMGFNVLEAYATILFTSFRTPFGFVQTLLKYVPLLLQALAFTVPLKAGKFNIGGEGQMFAGAFDAFEIGNECVLPEILGLFLEHLAVTDHSVERRSQLVAHVGEERTLGLVGFFGLAFGEIEIAIEVDQFGCAGFYFRFEVVPVLAKFGPATLDFGKHVIESVDQFAEFVVADFFGPEMIILTR